MKKIISALLIAALMLATFAACGNKPDDDAKETTASVNTVGIKLEFNANSGKKEFKNTDGKVVYKVEYSVPWLDKTYSEEAQVQFNNYVQTEFLDAAFNFAENNVKNVKPDEKDPRTIKISFEPLYKMDTVFSVKISTAYSSQSSIDVYRTFNLKNGFVLHAEEFFTQDVEETKKSIFEALAPEAASLLREDKEMSSKEKEALALEKLAAGFESASFYITDSYIAFVYNVSDFQEGMGASAGTHEFILDLTTYSYLGISNNPEEVLK